MNKEDLMRVWRQFAEKNDFMLNPDSKHIDFVVNGLLKNEKKFGLRMCPCRVRDGTKETDLGLICPCNFKAQDVWKEKGMCWCGLFVKRK